jgi:uncharacterized protein (TIGR00251 family)
MADAQIWIHVTPRAGRDEIAGWQGDELRVRLRAPPVDGQANEALRRLLAKQLGVSASAVAIVGGTTSRHKRVRIEGLTADEVRERLG